jgi:hypothetical protein
VAEPFRAGNFPSSVAAAARPGCRAIMADGQEAKASGIAYPFVETRQAGRA